MNRAYIATISFFIIIAGCTNPPNIDQPELSPSASDTVAVEDWEQMDLQATTRGEILERIRFYEGISGDLGALQTSRTRASSLYLLLGAAYSNSRSEQRKYYRQAAESAEKALLTNKAFRTARSAGSSIPEAAGAIEEDLFEPLFIWATAVFYHFRDVASLPERIVFRGRLKQAAEAVEVIMRKNPTWHEGSLQFSLGIYYLSVPEVIGGDRGKAMQLMKEAVAMSDNHLLPRWGRAKYMAVAMRDKQLFTEDLNWVLNQDPREMKGPAIWNRYFQEDAQRLLDNVDELF